MFVLEDLKSCGFIVRNTETDQTMLFQSDWDFPRLAQNFGCRSIICICDKTDGTIDCMHKTASSMIIESGGWLYGHIGTEVDGVGTFDDYPEECWRDE